MSGPSVLVMGGTGFIGKHLVQYMVDYNIAGRVRVADKVIPVMAHMDEKFEKTFEDARVEFVQCDLATERGREKAFNNERFGVIINLAALIEFGRLDEEYQIMESMRVQCAKKASELGCDKYIEVSTCAVYSAEGKGEKACKEDHPVKPQHVIAQTHYNAEKAILQDCPDLPVCIVRLPTVYGPADTSGLLPRLTCAASYVGQDQEMKLLYSEDLRLHTLHVQDAVGGIWYVACAGKNREVYNLVDKNDTTQKKLNKIVQEILPIKTSCAGHQTTKILLGAFGNFESVLEEANREHLENWSELLQEYDIRTSHLTTFLNREQLSGHPVSADGSKAEALGYQYSVPKVEAQYVRHAIQYWINRGCFPPVLKA